MKNFAFLFLLVTVFPHQASTQTRAVCPTGKADWVADGAKQRQVTRTQKFVFYRAELRVNTDGAANSYHPIGTSKGALNTICNGIAVYPATGPHHGQRISSISPKDMTIGQRCQVILDVFRAAQAVEYGPSKAGSIDWYAIALDQDPKSAWVGKPCIQTSGQFKGYFVAQTSLSADSTLGNCDVGRWVSSTAIPYITLPTGSKVFATAGANPGDLALVHRRIGDRDVWVTAVVADTGNSEELGEGSIALHHALGHMTRGDAPHPGNLREETTTFVFPEQQMPKPITAGALSDPKLAEELFSYAGGRQTLLDCTEENQARRK